jgi:hypothetical protein
MWIAVHSWDKFERFAPLTCSQVIGFFSLVPLPNGPGGVEVPLIMLRFLEARGFHNALLLHCTMSLDLQG